MTPKILTISPRYLIGIRIQTSLSENRTRELWQGFMPRRFEIQAIREKEYYSIQIFDKNQTMDDFTPFTMFEKWAAIEVADHKHIPKGMEALTLKGGLYAVFTQIGDASIYQKSTRFIIEEWVKNSEYTLDQRAHFEVMGDKYLGPLDPNSEEEVWVPVK